MPDYGLHFEWSPGIHIQDTTTDDPTDDKDSTYETSNSNNSVNSNDSDNDNDTIASDDESDNEHKEEENNDDDEPNNVTQQEPNNITENKSDSSEEDKDRSYEGEEAYDEQEGVANDEQEYDMETDGTNTHEDVNQTNTRELDVVETQTQAPRRYSLRNNRGPTYKTKFANAIDNPQSTKSYDSQFFQYTSGADRSLRDAVQNMQDSGLDTQAMQYISDFIMTQMTAKAGITKHGQVAVKAIYQECLQLHDLNVFNGQNAGDLTKKQKRAALLAISVIKEKRCGKIKRQTVADGCSQRLLYTKEQTASPTVSTDALMLSIMIDAEEGRDMATADVAGAYLHADLDDFTLLKVEGPSVNIMCKVSNKYTPFVTMENGKKVLYLRLLKALYGCVKLALLWYELFTGTLKGAGFELNPYDSCVANKTFAGKQCTIAWFVDNNKVSHVDSNVVTGVINTIEERFGKMTVTRGKDHVFLGMNIKFCKNGTAEVRMRDYLEEAIEDFGDKVGNSAVSPATKTLFEISENSPELDTKHREVLHSVTAKLLYVFQRGRMDIQLAIAFLCSRVSCSTEEDWSKLRRVLTYINGSLGEYRVIGADDISKMKTWVDAVYAVHHDMKSHARGVISFGTGAALSKSTEQKLNTKSSTEAELVGASDYLPNAIWTKKILEAQGYKITENKFYQYNESAIRFEKIGRRSSGQNSRHIDIRYFFIKDRLEVDDFDIEHCPTEQMLADFFTKPLQGALFRRLRAIIMGHAHIDTLKLFLSSRVKERVGIHNSTDMGVTMLLDHSTNVGVLVEKENFGRKKDTFAGSYADAVRNTSTEVKSRCARRVTFCPITIGK